MPKLHLELGYGYHPSALTTNELGDVTENPLTATARPGSKAPHTIVDTERRKNIPVADLFGGNYVLLLQQDGRTCDNAARRLNADLQLPPVKTYRIKGSDFGPKYGISPFGAVVIPPDGFVAWRTWQGPIPGTDAAETLRGIMRRILCLDASLGKEQSASLGIPEGVPFSGKNKLQAAVATSLSAALSGRTKALIDEKANMQRRIEKIDAEMADLRQMGELQDKMAMLAMKLMPVDDLPPDCSYSEFSKRNGLRAV